MPRELFIRSRKVLTPEGVRPASVLIRDGVIAAVADSDRAAAAAGCPVSDAGDFMVMPGLVDTHVHINDPGRTDWEGFASATRAAAAGGVTTIVDMPLNSIPATTTLEGLGAKMRAAERQLSVDVAFWGGVVPGNASELGRLAEAGVCGFKCFLVPSGVDEFPTVAESDLHAAFAELVSHARGLPVLVHAELPGPIEKAVAAMEAEGCRAERYSTWLAARPRAAENEAIALMARLSREYGVPVHIVHLSSSDALPILRRAKDEGVAITVETCPHYLCFAAEEIHDGSTEFKCAPPIRERENREKLWAALGEGLIDLVASDHSPCPPEMKCSGGGNFLRAWGGVSSLQLGLAVVWTEARQRGFSPERLAEWMCSAPARLAGLEKRKGAIAPGYDADLVAWDPKAQFRVEPEKLQHRHKLTPYAHRMLFGPVETTYLRGEKIYERGDFLVGPMGTILRRGKR